MYKSLSLLLAICALAILQGAFAHAQPPGPTRGKILTDPAKAKKVASITKKLDQPDKAKKVVSGLRLTHFEARRGTRDIELSAGIENVSLQPMTNVSFVMFKRTPTGWQRVNSGSNLTIKPRKTLYVTGLDAVTNAQMTYKIEVASPGQQEVREFVLQERKISFIVKFDTKGNWLTARYWAPNEPTARNTKGAPATGSDVLPGAFPRQLVDTLRGLGFESKMTYKRYDSAFADTEFEFWVYARTPALIQRTFTTRAAAEAFGENLRSLVRDKNLVVEIVER